MMEGEDSMMVGEEPPLPIETKVVMEKDIQLGEATFELFRDEDMNGAEFYYLVLPMQGKMFGILANLEGDLIDMQGNLMTSLEDLTEMLQDEDFDEFEGGFSGILIKEIELKEIVEDPEDPVMELDEEVNACQKCCGKIDGTVHHEVPVIVKQPCYYEKQIPVPVYRKKCIPYEVIKYVKEFIPKYEYVHIPVKVPVKVPINIEVPCYKHVTKVCPRYKTVHQVCPRFINKERIIECKVPKVVHIKVPCVQKRCVEVPVPYKVVKRCGCGCCY